VKSSDHSHPIEEDGMDRSLHMRYGRLRRLGAVALAIVAGCVAASFEASGQTYPERNIRIVVPTSAGGNLTIVARAIAQKLSESFGRQVIVDNRPGGNGAIGSELVAHAAPDGYTLLLAANTFVSTPVLVPNIAYDPVGDFTGVSLVAKLPQALVVHPSVPVHSVKELIALARKRPKDLIEADQGEASTGRIASALFTEKTKAQFLHVPYKGGAPAMIAVMSGEASLLFATASTALPQIKAGRIRALAVTSRARSPAFPGVPTIQESGVPGYESIVFNLIVAPANTPLDVRARLQSEIARVVKIPELRELFVKQGVELTASASPDECTALVKQEYEVYKDLWSRLGLAPRK
jgi:tripartite-type tricarboxylate transporter receptor subunit TctC